ncbi:MAG TPA: hypothetical protein VHP33_06640 [Polyangiaceae bacterium]|nr:hypothetical protein [Polyangiaceae bacterium]
MTFVPTLCVACCRVQLTSTSKATSGDLACSMCGGELRIVPGCSYVERDRDAFCDLSDIVAEGCVTPTEAGSLADQLERALWSGAYARALEQLAARMPGLLPLQVAAGRNSGAQRQVLALLKTILDAVATARRVSAAYPIVTDSTRLRTKS